MRDAAREPVDVPGERLPGCSVTFQGTDDDRLTRQILTSRSLVIGGEAGARRLVSMFREEVDLAMGFLGIKTLAELGPDFLWFDGLAAGRSIGRRND